MIVEDTFLATVNKYRLLSAHDRILVAVSGGPDSVALLYLLNSLKEKMRLTLYIAHLDHKLRPCSAKDLNFVRKLSQDLNIPISTKRVNVNQHAKLHKLSIEDAARGLRYKFFFQAAKKYNLSKIATAHTQDDQAETIIIRMVKGTGSCGLCGILPKRTQQGVTIIRPLITTAKQELLGFLKKNRLKFCHDKTNLKPIYLRNIIRLRIIPELEKINPRFKQTVSRMSENLRADYNFLTSLIMKKYRRFAQETQNEIRLPFMIAKLHPALIRGIVRQAIERVKGGKHNIDYKHWQLIEKLLTERSSLKAIQLPENVTVLRQDRDIVFLNKRQIIPKKQIKQRVNIPGITLMPEINKKIVATVVKRPKVLKLKPKIIEYIDADKINKPVYLRTRRPGDRFQPLGFKNSLKLKDFLINEKIPQGEKDKRLLLVCGKDIIWVTGVRISEKFKIISVTKHCLRFELLNYDPRN
ncbi:MAG: tRNA lysidine(34) synthetase TilS [Candidatus Omnitrophota bacterium]